MNRGDGLVWETLTKEEEIKQHPSKIQDEKDEAPGYPDTPETGDTSWKNLSLSQLLM